MFGFLILCSKQGFGFWCETHLISTPSSKHPLSVYWLGTGGLPKKFTILFKKFNPNTVSSQLTFTVTSRGSKHFPSTVSVTKHGIELLKISVLNRRHRPVASSSRAATGSSIDMRKTFALLSIFNARLLQMRRNLSSSIGSSPFPLFSFPRWSVNVPLKYTTQPELEQQRWGGSDFHYIRLLIKTFICYSIRLPTKRNQTAFKFFHSRQFGCTNTSFKNRGK